MHTKIARSLGENGAAAVQSIVESPAFRREVGALEGERLKRVPRGFPGDHPAADYLRYRQFIVGCEFPAAFATSPRFYDSS